MVLFLLGVPMECIEDVIDTEEISTEMLKGGKEYFGLKVKGNSMEPEYLDGDTLLNSIYFSSDF